MIMEESLKKEDIDYVFQYPIRGSYIIDFAIPHLKIAIECDGEIWHPIKNNYDRKKNWFLRNRGWEILRFRGEEIKNNISKCINKIKEVINGKNKS